MTIEKLCVFCQNWYFSGGEPGYSEMTPGSNASMGCTKGHYGRWFKLSTLDGEDAFRSIIQKAETCPDYTPPISKKVSK
jgi:uncharacterized Fe-S radical SAM superfamily protein PflX